jgi:excisionase family DNA binding protein
VSSNGSDYLVTAYQLADWVQVPPGTVYRWIREGELAAVRVNRTIRIRASQIEKVFGIKPPRPSPMKAAS